MESQLKAVNLGKRPCSQCGQRSPKRMARNDDATLVIATYGLKGFQDFVLEPIPGVKETLVYRTSATLVTLWQRLADHIHIRKDVYIACPTKGNETRTRI